jgi:hypothetical protein
MLMVEGESKDEEEWENGNGNPGSSQPPPSWRASPTVQLTTINKRCTGGNLWYSYVSFVKFI